MTIATIIARNIIRALKYELSTFALPWQRAPVKKTVIPLRHYVESVN